MKKYLTLMSLIALSINVFAQTDNEVLGTGAGSSITTGDSNVFIGDNAGMSVSSGSRNTFVGESAGLSQTTATDSTFIGHEAGFSVTTAHNNTFIGKHAGYNNTDGFDNTFIGEEAGYSNTEGDENVFIGEDAGYYNTTAGDNTAIGDEALRNNQIGQYNTAVGKDAGWEIGTNGVNSVRNTVVGNKAGKDIGAGVGNTCLGANACTNTEHADFNTFVGLQAGFDNNRDNGNNVNNAQRNTGLGTYAGYTNRSGTDNVWIGAFSDSGMRLPSFDHEAEVSLMQTGADWDPGDSGFASGGDDTIFRTTVMGAFASAGENDSIAIGYNSRADKTNSIAIGANASGTATDDITLGYNTSNTGNQSITIGNTTNSTHVQAITIGYGSVSHATDTVILGNATTTNWDPNTDAVTSLGRVGNPMYRFTDVVSNKVSVNATSTNAAQIDLFADAGANNDDKWTIAVANGGDFSISSFASGVDVNKFSIANTGDVIIAGDLALNSDRRLKTNINSITNSLDSIMQLDGKSYYWKDKNRSQGQHLGFIAQEVEEVLPQLVSQDKAGIKSVNYQGMMPVLVNAIKEMNNKNDTKIFNAIKELKDRNDEQDKMILQLQNLIEQQQSLIIKLSR